MEQQSNPLPEITVKAIILGAVLSIILAAANAYLGLFAGMTVSASIPAAVVSMGILRLFKNSNILENNVIKTAASAGESLAAGAVFTLPALVIMGFWQDFNFWWVTIITGLGGILGVLFTIPLRRSLIVEDKLPYPEGVATAEVLKSGYQGGAEIRYLVQASIAGATFKLGSSGLGLWSEIVAGARKVGGSIAYFGSNLSPALISVGYIVGLNTAILMFIGGVINWLAAVPVCAWLTKWPVTDGGLLPAIDFAKQIWSSQTRYIGVGGMLVGGLWTVFKLRGSILRGFKSGIKAYQTIGGQTATVERTEKDVPMKWTVLMIIASIVPIFFVYEFFVGKFTIAIPMAIIMVFAGFLFAAVAGYMAGIVGSSNNPISGVTIATVLLSSLLLLVLMGRADKTGPPAAVIIGAVVCCAAAIAGDTMQDLKTGHIIKNTPWKLQVIEMVGTVAAAFVIAPVLMLLLRAYGFKGHSSAVSELKALAAPQANLMAAVSKQVFEGKLPWAFVIIGAAIAIAVIILDEYLIRRGSSFRTPVLAVAIGIYLPLELEVPILAGGIISFLVARSNKKRDATTEMVETGNRRGILLASGFITGESLLGILLAIPIAISGSIDVLKITPERIARLPVPQQISNILSNIITNNYFNISVGIILIFAVAIWLYCTARAKK